MPASIGVNLRVTGHCRQGGRKYMEDFFSVAYQQTEDERDLEYAFFGIYDGHGGAEAAAFAKEHLMETIIKHKTFWSDNDEDVLRAIKDGYIATHYAMWKEQEKWPRTASGLPSTAGTTASVAFIRRGKIYIGHVGDSGIILGYQENGSPEWKAKPLTRDHKPENLDEMTRINQCGGKVVAKSGVPRVVWNRPKMGHQGPVRRSTPIDEIPFLAVARSLGDLWSYNSQINQFIVSPDPDCAVFTIDTAVHRCLIFGTDGLFNMLSPQNAVHIVQQAERHNEHAALSDSSIINKTWLNPSKLLVEKALERWHNTKMRADNTSVVTLMLDPPGPPRAQVLKNRKNAASATASSSTGAAPAAYPDSGLKIMTRYEDDRPPPPPPQPSENKCKNCGGGGGSGEEQPPEKQDSAAAAAAAPTVSSSESAATTAFPLKERNSTTAAATSKVRDCDPKEAVDKENLEKKEDSSIQINEISSSSNDFNDNSCEERDLNESRHNLRSGGGGGCGGGGRMDKGARGTKRKHDAAGCDDGVIRVRKSSRLGGGGIGGGDGETGKKEAAVVKATPKNKLELAHRILRSRKGPVLTTTTTKKKKKKKEKKAQLRKKQPLRSAVKKKALDSTKKSVRKSLRNAKGGAAKAPPPKTMPKRSDVQKNRNRRLRRK